MLMQVTSTDQGHRLRRLDDSVDSDLVLTNRFLAHLVTRCFSPATVRSYAYDLLNFHRFLTERQAHLGDVVSTDAGCACTA